jgi:hypothetical protein
MTLQSLRPALVRLDAALAREVLRLRARYQLSLDEFRGLYVSDEQVDALLSRAAAPPDERGGSTAITGEFGARCNHQPV